MVLRLGFAGCVLAAIATGCQPDSPSITEVEGTLDHHPERPSCHFEPEAITTVEGEDEVVLIEFTYGGGATWGDAGGDCGENPGSDLQGVLLASHGVSYSDSIGGDGDFLALNDCSLSEAFGRPCNVPSLPNALWIDALLGYSGYLRFEPPVSELSFRVCSNQSHGLTAWDSLGNQIVPETVGPSNGTYLDSDLYCDSQGWEEFGIQASGYDISRVRLRRWDPGVTYWDDMTFRREAPPGIECDTVIRGSPTTCSIIDTNNVETIEEWRFQGVDHLGQPLDSAVVNTQNDATTWSGKAVANGLVTARLIRDEQTEVVAGSLYVETRGGRWSEDPSQGVSERHFEEGAARYCESWTALRMNRHDQIQPVVLAWLDNLETDLPCGDEYIHRLLPKIDGSDGFEYDQVTDAETVSIGTSGGRIR